MNPVTLAAPSTSREMGLDHPPDLCPPSATPSADPLPCLPGSSDFLGQLSLPFSPLNVSIVLKPLTSPSSILLLLCLVMSMQKLSEQLS